MKQQVEPACDAAGSYNLFIVAPARVPIVSRRQGSPGNSKGKLTGTFRGQGTLTGILEYIVLKHVISSAVRVPLAHRASIVIRYRYTSSSAPHSVTRSYKLIQGSRDGPRSRPGLYVNRWNSLQGNTALMTASDPAPRLSALHSVYDGFCSVCNGAAATEAARRESTE